MQSVSQWMARHDPHYIARIDGLHMQRQIAYESEERKYSNQIELLNRSNSQQWDLARYKEEQTTQRENERGRMAVSVEQERGKNRLSELDRELQNKIKVMGIEQQFALAQKFVDELAKDREWYRGALSKLVDFRLDMQKQILQAMLAEQLAQSGHWRELEKIRLDAEHKERLQEIEQFHKNAVAFGETAAAMAGEKAGAEAVESLINRWKQTDRMD